MFVHEDSIHKGYCFLIILAGFRGRGSVPKWINQHKAECASAISAFHVMRDNHAENVSLINKGVMFLALPHWSVCQNKQKDELRDSEARRPRNTMCWVRCLAVGETPSLQW